MRRFDRYLQEGQAFTEHRASPSAGVKDRTCATEDVEMPVTTPESTPPPPLPGASTIDTFSVPLKPSAPQSITVDTGLAEFTEEGFALYCKYQKSVHGDPDSKLSPEGYTNFLVASPFPQNAANRPLASGKDKKRGRTSEDVSLGSSSGAAKPRMLGTYHQQYRIDGRLVAVGVVDFVPSGLSSVYCFYDPELKHLALGKYTALREIQYCLDHGLDFYYMGYYIHTCPKMRYKGDYVPSELLCPTTFTWHHLRDCVPLLDQNKFTPLSPGLIKPYQTLRAAIDKVNENNDAGSVENVASAKPPTSSDIKDEKMISKLKHFFGPDADKKLTYNPNMCLMKMSDNRPLNIHMFRAEYRAEIASLVNEWLRLIGPDNFKRFGVVFS
jgi:arginyl-tRNA--protein-N-Asp/Glu arginylyltransferase